MTQPDPSSPPAKLPAPPAAAAEHRAAARAGAALFRNRGWLPVPFLVVTLLVPARPTTLHWIVGVLLIAVGEWVRLAGVAAAGTVTRRRSRNVQRLVTYGVFQWVRNPLYLGNFLIWMGVVVLSAVLWFLPIGIAIFAIEYTLIVIYEESVLETIFGAEYLAYKRSTPRWIPRPPRHRTRGEHNWSEAWRSEVSTFLQYAALIAAFAIKEKIWWD